MPRTNRDADGLTPRQARFVREYLIDLNAIQAATRAGYGKATARRASPELLALPVIRAAVDKAIAARSKRTQITADRVLEELGRIAFSDIRQVMTWDKESSSFVPSKDLPDEAAAIVSSVKSKRRTTCDKDGGSETTLELEIKTYDKVQALTQIGRHLGMFTEKIEVDDVSGLSPEERVERTARLLDAARARRDGQAPGGG